MHPPEAIYEIGAASKTVLMHDTEDLRHRIVYFAEADSIPDEGPAASGIRNLLSSNTFSYKVTETINGRMVVITKERPGPTGLITTGIRSVGQELGTIVGSADPRR